MITQNILGRQQDWESRRAVLQAGFGELAPDLVLFQEAVVTGDYDQVVDVLGDGYHVAHQSHRDITGEIGSGISIASRWPLGAQREIDLRVGARTVDFPAGALVVDVRWDRAEEPLLLVNHKPSWPTNVEYEREVQAVRTARFVEEIVERTGQHVLLGGDFDAMPDASSVRFWRGLHSLDGTSVSYRDAWELTHGGEPGATFAPSVNPLMEAHWQADLDRRIDYLLVRCGREGPTMRVVECDRVFAGAVAGAWGSDHIGVLAQVEPRESG
ncbi:endonuclease/exonuclease/phosphatase family protein [Actinophytocola gossypii]|uniref:Endonuclease/exonuclease/phosphatase family protein n=1 Tax=Actinophytocola gossypii TaxID=2812003 RepID=A0ABT2J7N9_9PSEU|nr:endonuclease/exonuclease/phosphatase family protein [Actinophytocola gossypii]MCT2583803.1 endonuclease/exonuclease/phosphatase family protein [Actinophytocola gossypii]